MAATVRGSNATSAHYHLARPLVTALDDIKALGEVDRCPLLGTHANYLDELASDGLNVKSGVTATSGEDDAPLCSLRYGSGCCRLNALGQEVVGHRDGLRSTQRQQAHCYVEHSLHLAS